MHSKKTKKNQAGIDHIPGCRPLGPSTETPVEYNKKQSKSSIQCEEVCRTSQEQDYSCQPEEAEQLMTESSLTSDGRDRVPGCWRWLKGRRVSSDVAT